jgi:hypothetical protein
MWQAARGFWSGYAEAFPNIIFILKKWEYSITSALATTCIEII